VGCAGFQRPVKTVKHAHDTFNYRNVCAVRCMNECFPDLFLTHHKGVKVPRVPPADAGMVGWIDEIRTYFEGLNDEPLRGEGLHQATYHGCFTTSAMSPGDKDPWNVNVFAHEMTFPG